MGMLVESREPRLNSTGVIDVLSDLYIMRGVPGHVLPLLLFTKEADMGLPARRVPVYDFAASLQPQLPPDS